MRLRDAIGLMLGLQMLTACMTTPEMPEGKKSEQPAGPRMSPKAQAALAAYSEEDRYPHFKAFAWDPATQAFGSGWGTTTPQEAIERARYNCARYGQACLVLAVGGFAVHGPGAIDVEQAKASYYRQITGMEPQDVLRGETLDTDQILDLLTDRHMRGATFAGVPFTAMLSSSGEAVSHLYRADGSLQRSDSGIWWAEHDRLCRRFGSFYSGHRVCHRLIREGEIVKIVDERGNLVSRVMVE